MTPAAEQRPWDVRSVVFDLDGLLVDTEPVFDEVARRLLTRRGLEVQPHILHAMMGTPAEQALEILCRHYQLSEAIADLNAESTSLLFDLLGKAPAPLLPGVRALLDRLEHRGLPRAIATSSGRAYVEHVLGPHQLLERFAFVLTCEDVERGKPFPEVYEKAAARLGHPAAAMVVLEDSPNGLRAAKAAGARCVVVLHERVPRAEITSADAILPSLAAPELYELLGV